MNSRLEHRSAGSRKSAVLNSSSFFDQGYLFVTDPYLFIIISVLPYSKNRSQFAYRDGTGGGNSISLRTILDTTGRYTTIGIDLVTHPRGFLVQAC